MEWLKFCIDCNQSLRTAMKQLDQTAKKILFITADNNQIVASFTDGDMRRFLLAGGTMDDPVFMASNHNPKKAKSREEARKILVRNEQMAIPVIYDNGEVIDIVFGNEPETIKCPQLDIPVVVMAGGKGTRLDPYTRILPKPLIPVGDLPIIEHIMAQFTKFGCNEFHIIVNHKKQLIKAYFGENERQYTIDWYDEDKPLGTGGGLYLLKGKINETFFLSNCDILIQADYDDILRFHREQGNVITMICAYKNVTIPYGVIEMGENGVIQEMKEKPELSFLTNTGMYLVEPEVLDGIENDVAVGFPDIIEKQKQKGHRVAVYPISENDWLDMGQMTELEEMRERLYGKD